jgi:polysaccharide biosynthesis/export protein
MICNRHICNAGGFMATTTIDRARRLGGVSPELDRWCLRRFGLVLCAMAAMWASLAIAQGTSQTTSSASDSAAVVAVPQGAALQKTDVDVVPAERTAPGATRIEPVEEDYRIGTQDLLEVQVLGVQDLHREARVNAKGMIGLPLIGAVHVAGLTTAEAETLIAGMYRKDYLQNPEVSVFVKEFTRQSITLEGAVGKPGIYPLKGPTTLMQAIANAGGQGQLADLTNVVLFRMEDSERRAIKFDVIKIHNAEAPDPLMQPGDLVMVNRAPARVFVRDSLFGDIVGIFNPFSYIGRP